MSLIFRCMVPWCPLEVVVTPVRYRVKFDEAQLATRLAGTPAYTPALPADVQVTKRVEYILEKWTARGWWDYGVSLRTGWLTPDGASGMCDLYCDAQDSEQTLASS